MAKVTSSLAAAQIAIQVAVCPFCPPCILRDQSIRQRFGNPVEPLIDRRDLVL
jgi:hypothetical protein